MWFKFCSTYHLHAVTSHITALYRVAQSRLAFFYTVMLYIRIHQFYATQGRLLIFWQGKTWRWPASFSCLNRFTKLSKTRHSSPWFVVAILTRTARFSSCIACGWLICTHYFRYSHRSKSVAVRSGDRTGQEIPDTWKYSLSFINRSVVTKQVSKWHVIVSYSMCRLYHLPPE